MYIKKFNSIIKVHDLVFIARKINAPENIVEMCKELSPAYLYTRYPDVIPIKNIKITAEKLLIYAEEILRWAEQKI